ncbi:PH domain-containing protein [Amycolatopsis jejuensis]|uniref:PH domain-containing protein n=1 Tax=Amycolatopsis jejuensis TaxID=330084 RepID=UPI000AC41A95
MAKKEQHQRTDEGRRAVFRIPTTAYLAIGLLTICVTPVALGEIGGFQWLYVFPLALLVFVARTRTVATREGLQVRTVFGKRDLPWSSLKGLAITGKARVRAVLGDDTQISLPTVRTRHLPVLALVSEGKIQDPSGVLSDEELTGQASASESGEAEGSGAPSPSGGETPAEASPSGGETPVGPSPASGETSSAPSPIDGETTAAPSPADVETPSPSGGDTPAGPAPAGGETSSIPSPVSGEPLTAPSPMNGETPSTPSPVNGETAFAPSPTGGEMHSTPPSTVADPPAPAEPATPAASSPADDAKRARTETGGAEGKAGE